MFATTALRPPARLAVVLMTGALLAGCSFGFGGGGSLPAGLVAPMDRPGAVLDKREAVNILNSYRATTGAPALNGDAALDSLAQTLATQYAGSGNPPALPPNTRAIRISAGYSNFAETFSGWRNSPADAAVLADAAAHRSGIGVAYNPSSSYGVYWVLLLAE
jgi:uncharacterized protein YkwD